MKLTQLSVMTATALALMSSGAQAFTIERQSHSGTSYVVATVDLTSDRLALHWLNPTTRRPYLRFTQLEARLSKQGQATLFATNSGIFAPGWRPLGLHVEGGKELVGLNLARSGGNFALLPNGVFWVTGARAGVTETHEYAANPPRPTFATQSGPLLVRRGQLHPSFRKDSLSVKRRSGVGVCAGGKVNFVVSDGLVNFHTFATFFRDRLGCPDALYLDGSLSAYRVPGLDTQLVDFAGMWTVTRAR